MSSSGDGGDGADPACSTDDCSLITFGKRIPAKVLIISGEMVGTQTHYFLKPHDY